MTEAQIQAKVIKKLRAAGALVIKLETIGRRGLPDLMVVGTEGRVAFVELKTPKGRTTKLQEHWLDELQRRGFTAGVARSVDEAIEIVYDVLPPDEAVEAIDV